MCTPMSPSINRSLLGSAAHVDIVVLRYRTTRYRQRHSTVFSPVQHCGTHCYEQLVTQR